MIPKIDVRNPSVCRSGRWKRRRRVNAVSMARWEYFGCQPRVPMRAGSQVAMASGDNHRVTSPRRTSARSYEAQLATPYFVLYPGWIRDLISSVCSSAPLPNRIERIRVSRLQAAGFVHQRPRTP
jgi:hypothetical protein